MRDEKEGRSRPQGERLDLASCLTLSNLMAAARKCYRGVSWKRQPVLFMNRLLTNCQELRDEVLSGRYVPRDPPRFTVNERGKIRLIKPVDFRDRVVQRCLADHVIVPAIVPAMVEDCSACLEGRGLAYALERVRGHAASCPPDGWGVQYDFHDYGSSPLARGAHHPRRGALARPRIIPACAGSTRRRRLPRSPWWDHPRLRGEHFFAEELLNRIVGSSPLARGARTWQSATGPRSRIIPACAGSTS